jgi:hypothetical protein
MMKATIAAVMALALAAGSVNAAMLAYEGFDYTAGSDINTPLNGGFGFTGAWAPAQQAGVLTVYDETAATVVNGNVGSEITWDGVVDNVPTSPAVGSRFVTTGTSGADRITAQRVLSQNAGALAGADNTLWASVVWHQEGSNYGRHVGFALGTDDLANRSANIDSGGDGIGVGGAFNTTLVTPTIWTGGAVAVRTTTGATAVSTSEDNLVVLKFVFGATDTVYAYRFTESDTISEADFNTNAISASWAIDETTMDVLSFSQSRGAEAVDEIRLGDDFADVIPEPATMTLLALGGLAALRRRRK